MSRSIGLSIIVFFVFCLSNTARADLDYQCLKNCVNNGEPASICMPKCSYATKVKPFGIYEQKTKLNAHNQFSAMISPDVEIIDNHKTQSINKTIDYLCLSKCLQNKSQYQFCEEQCADKPLLFER